MADAPVRPHLRVIAHPPQQPVRDAGCTARALGDLACRIFVDLDAEDARRAPHDLVDVLLGVVVEPVHDAEPRAQRRRQQSRPRRRADQAEALHGHLHRARARPLADDDVELVILHRRIQDLFDRRRHAVDLVDEEDLAFLQVREHRRKVARFLDHRPGGRPNRHAQLVGDHRRQRRLAEPGGTVEQHVVERFAALFRGFDRHVQVLADPILADVFVERARTEARLVLARHRCARGAPVSRFDRLSLLLLHQRAEHRAQRRFEARVRRGRCSSLSIAFSAAARW